MNSCWQVGNTLDMGFLADLDSPTFYSENQYIYDDNTLKISGDDSIIGNSLAISKDGTRIACCVIGKASHSINTPFSTLDLDGPDGDSLVANAAKGLLGGLIGGP